MKRIALLLFFTVGFVCSDGLLFAQSDIRYYSDFDLFELRGKGERKADTTEVPCIKTYYRDGKLVGWQYLQPGKQKNWGSLTKINRFENITYLSDTFSTHSSFEYLTVKIIGRDTLTMLSFQRPLESPPRQKWRLFEAEYVYNRGESSQAYSFRKLRKTKRPLEDFRPFNPHTRQISSIQQTFFLYDGNRIQKIASQISLDDGKIALGTSKRFCFDYPFKPSYFWWSCSGIGKSQMY